jgi:hypothetical protein
MIKKYNISRKLILFVMIFVILLPTKISFAQQIEAQVKMTLERLPLEKQKRLKNFAEEIEKYINENEWSEDEFEEPIPVIIQIFLQDNSVSYEEKYMGTFLISNNSDIQYFDKYWKFPYQAGTTLVHNENIYEPFTGFINYYIYIILGNEYDKLGRLLGTPFFEKAKLISEQAMFDSRYVWGWEERGELIDNVLSKENKPYREMKDLFFLGLSYVGYEDTTAQKYCSQAILLIEKILKDDPKHKETLNFLNAHYIKIIDIFKENTDALEKMILIDPERTEIYKKYIKED